jgi:hypothetical protein
MMQAARQVESDGNWITFWVRTAVLNALVVQSVINSFIDPFIG